MEYLKSLYDVKAGGALGAARWIAVFVFAGLIGWFGAQLVWLLVAPGGAVSEPLDLRMASQTAAPQTRVSDRSILFTKNAFSAVQVLVAEAVPDAPETTLNLKLRGSRAETRDHAGAAYILTPDNKLGTYAVGDEVLSGVEISGIYSNRILLSKSGQLESLYLEGRSEELSVIGNNRQKTEDSETATLEREAPQDNEIKTVDGNVLLSSLNIQPVLEDGNLTGYSLSPRGDAGVMAASGLQPGDILTGIDGDRVGDIEMGDITGRLQSASEVTLTLNRNSNTVRQRLKLQGAPTR